jgi:hypothetical protein
MEQNQYISIFIHNELSNITDTTILQQTALQVKQRFDFRRNAYYQLQNQYLDLEKFKIFRQFLTNYEQLFNQWNNRWNEVYRINQNQDYGNYFVEGNNIVQQLENFCINIKPEYIKANDVEKIRKDLIEKIEVDFITLKNDISTQINNGIKDLLDFKAELGLFKTFDKNMSDELERNDKRRFLFLCSFIASLVLISIFVLCSFLSYFLPSLSTESKFLVRLGTLIPLSFLSYFLFTQYRLYQILQLKLAHLKGFLGGGSTYINQLIGQDNETKRDTNKKLAQMFVDIDDIIVHIKEIKHPADATLTSLSTNMDTLTKSVTELMKIQKNV